MRKITLAISLPILCFTFACQNEKTETVEEFSQPKTEGSSTLPEFTDDYLVSIYEAQELIKIDQDNREMRERYCEKALHPSKELFVSMGIGRLHQPDGTPIPRHLAERAAKLDAIRWAGYGVHWMKENYEPSFGQLKTTTTFQTEVIDRAIVGDSMFVFIASRLSK